VDNEFSPNIFAKSIFERARSNKRKASPLSAEEGSLHETISKMMMLAFMADIRLSLRRVLPIEFV